MTEWYVRIDGQERGPGSTDALRGFLKNNEPKRFHVWREGFDGWKLASEVPELSGQVRPPSPTLIAGEPIAGQVVAGRVVTIERKAWRWAKFGALGGVALAVFNISILEDWSSDPVILVDQFLGLLLPYGLIGLASGAIFDAISGPAAPLPAPDLAAVQPRRGGNFIVRHWRGDLKLWVSYWVISFVSYVTVAVVGVAAPAIFKTKTGFYPPAIFATFVTIWGSALVVSTWQTVGLWRSAWRYSEERARAGRSRIWGGVAQVLCVLGALGGIGNFVSSGAPQLREAYSIAFLNDPNIPDYAIRVMRDGTEAEIVGGFKYGLTDDFTKILSASKAIKVVHLDSIGGRLGEGRRLYELIRDRGLTTYVSSNCLSACTVAFAGGKERHLRKGATLGFHRGAFPGSKEREWDGVQATVFRRAGFDGNFIKTALSTPHSDMWRPSEDVLIKARVVTRVSDGSQFAYSGLGTIETDKTALSERLVRASPVMLAMQQRFPKQFATFLDEYQAGITKGKTRQEMKVMLRDKLMPFLEATIPLADDDVVLEYSRLVVDQYVALSNTNASHCYAYASSDRADLSFKDELPEGLMTREAELQERAIRTATKREAMNEATKSALFKRVIDRLLAAGLPAADIALMAQRKVEPINHARYCAAAIKFFREALRLPERDAAAVMRNVLKQR
jgi:hypothetical protein